MVTSIVISIVTSIVTSVVLSIVVSILKSIEVSIRMVIHPSLFCEDSIGGSHNRSLENQIGNVHCCRPAALYGNGKSTGTSLAEVGSEYS